MSRLLLLAGLLSACAYTRSAEVPMRFTEHPAAARPKGVVLLLPGLGDSPEKLADNGFVQRVNALGYDAVTVDSHFGYFRERIFRERFEADVVKALAARGYREVWLAGVSLGGFGSALHAMEHPGTVTGLILLSPFLGEEDTWGRIRDAGGLAKWDPGDVSKIEDQDERALIELWVWLAGYATDPGARPEMYLGYGASDRFEPACRLLKEALPADRVRVQPGGHEWKTWRPIFEVLSERALGGE